MREPYELELLLLVFEDVGAQHLLTGEGEVTSEGVLHGGGAEDEGSAQAEAGGHLQGWSVGQRVPPVRVLRRAAAGRPESVRLRARPGDQGAEAALLCNAARRIIEGASAESIAQEWNVDGVTTVTGRRWRGKSLRRIITAPSIAGRRVHHGEEVAALRAEAAALTRRLDQARDRLDRGVLDEEDYVATKRTIRAEQGVIQRKITSAARTSQLVQLASAADPVAAWRGLDLAARRAVIDALATVTLLPGRFGKFNPGTVRIEWRV